jgi:hypothetical protein
VCFPVCRPGVITESCRPPNDAAGDGMNRFSRASFPPQRFRFIRVSESKIESRRRLCTWLRAPLYNVNFLLAFSQETSERLRYESERLRYG